MRALHAARGTAQKLADATGKPHVIWAVAWRVFVQPEGKEVPGGQEIETIYPERKEEVMPVW